MYSAEIDDFINVQTANLKHHDADSWIARIRQHSRVFDLAVDRWQWRRIHQQTIDYYHHLYDEKQNPMSLLLTLRTIRTMHEMQDRAGKKFLVVIFPLFVNVEGDYPFADIHAKLRQRLEGAGVPYLDLLPAYKSYRSEDLWVHPLDRHPNEVAHRIAAETIAEFLLAEGWVR